AAREAAAAADAFDFFVAACGGLCRSLRAADYAAAAGRLPGAGGPLHFYGVRARRSAGLPRKVAAEFVPFCSHTGHYILFSRTAGRGGASHLERAAEAEVLRSRNGSRAFVRPAGKFSAVSGAHHGRLRQNGGDGQLRGSGWDPAGEQTAKTDARNS